MESGKREIIVTPDGLFQREKGIGGRLEEGNARARQKPRAMFFCEPIEQRIPGGGLARNEFRRRLGAIAEEVAAAEAKHLLGHAGAVGGNGIDRGKGETREQHGMHIDRLALPAPFPRNRFREGFRRQDQRCARRGLDRLIVEQDGGAAVRGRRRRYPFVKPLHPLICCVCPGSAPLRWRPPPSAASVAALSPAAHPACRHAARALAPDDRSSSPRRPPCCTWDGTDTSTD